MGGEIRGGVKWFGTERQKRRSKIGEGRQERRGKGSDESQEVSERESIYTHTYEMMGRS